MEKIPPSRYTHMGGRRLAAVPLAYPPVIPKTTPGTGLKAHELR
jgi:hypothetical protein